MEKVFKVRSEINKNNLDEAVKILGKIKIGNENEQEQINLLFGDIYLKINQPTKAEEFYEKSFMTTDENIESLTFNFPDFSPIPNEKIFFPKLTIDLPIFFTLSIVPETKSPIPFQTSVITLTPF